MWGTEMLRCPCVATSGCDPALYQAPSQSRGSRDPKAPASSSQFPASQLKRLLQNPRNVP